MTGHNATLRDRVFRAGRALWLCLLLTMPSAGEAGKTASHGSRLAAGRPYALERTVQWRQTSSEGQSYIVSLAIPSGQMPTNGFPVITVLDASWSFATLVEAARAQEPFFGPAVIVGIGCPPGEEKRRQFDLTIAVDRKTLPANRFDPPYGPVGGADAFLAFLTGSVRTAVEARVRTDNKHQILFGHSLGGLFALHTLFTHSNAFQTYVVASPSIWFGNRAILGEMHSYLVGIAAGNAPHPLLLTVGGLEQTVQPAEDALSVKAVKPEDATAVVAFSHCYTAQVAEIDSVRYVARALMAAHADTSFAEFPGEDHMSVIPSYLSRGLRFALHDALTPSLIDKGGLPAAPALLPPINLHDCARF